MHRLTLHATGIMLVLPAWALGPQSVTPHPPETLPKIEWNDNREPAGTLRDGVLELRLEIVEGRWHLLGEDQPAGSVLAFREPGKPPSIPGPLIRVPAGTDVRVTVTNPLDTALVLHGFGARRDEVLRPLRLTPGATRTSSRV